MTRRTLNPRQREEAALALACYRVTYDGCIATVSCPGLITPLSLHYVAQKASGVSCQPGVWGVMLDFSSSLFAVTDEDLTRGLHRPPWGGSWCPVVVIAGEHENRFEHFWSWGAAHGHMMCRVCRTQDEALPEMTREAETHRKIELDRHSPRWVLAKPSKSPVPPAAPVATAAPPTPKAHPRRRSGSRS